VGVHQVLQEGLLGLKAFGTVEDAAQGRRVVDQPRGARTPGIDLDHPTPNDPQTFSSHSLRRSSRAPDAVREDAQARIAAAHPTVRHGSDQIDRPAKVEGRALVGASIVHYGALIPQVDRAVSSWLIA
jgi:hypothetical protein